MNHRLLILIALVVLLCPCIAEAHLVTTGLGPIYDGIGHLVTTIDDLIPVLGFALLAGLRGPKSGRWALFVLPIAWFIGGLFGLQAMKENEFPFQCASFLIIGTLIATNLKLSPLGVAAIAIVFGLFHGYANGTAIKDVGTAAGILEFIGIVVSLFVIVALISAFVIWFRWDWARIILRVAGSWIFAMGLLYLGWTIAKNRQSPRPQTVSSQSITVPSAVP